MDNLKYIYNHQVQKAFLNVLHNLETREEKIDKCYHVKTHLWASLVVEWLRIRLPMD